jgi:lysophospholipase L1-like esterase
MHRMTLTSLVLASAIGLGLAHTAVATTVLLALGDSITRGETDLNYNARISYGDDGYVADFADYLATKNGTRPKVINLAIDGETAASFMDASNPRTPPVVGRTNVPLAKQNLNYAANPRVPQQSLFDSTVAAQKSAGNSIDYTTITLGFNGLAALASEPPEQALADVGPELASYKSAYDAVLGHVREQLPDTNLYLLNYYNPFAIAGADNPAKPIFAKGGMQLNNIIKGLAAKYDAYYVDNATPFMGHIADYTYIAEYPAGATAPGDTPFGDGIEPVGDVHPNAAGYQVIAQQIESAQKVVAVPEPSSLGLLGLGLGLMLMIWTRAKRTSGRPRG